MITDSAFGLIDYNSVEVLSLHVHVIVWKVHIYSRLWKYKMLCTREKIKTATTKCQTQEFQIKAHWLKFALSHTKSVMHLSSASPRGGPRADVGEYGDFMGTLQQISVLVVGEMWGLRFCSTERR